MTNLSEIEKLELIKKVIKEPYNKMGKTWYEAYFRSLNELYTYLSIEPEINTDIFQMCSSMKPLEKSRGFYEMEYQDALKYLLGGYPYNIDKIIELKKDLRKTVYFPTTRRKVIKSFTGSRICQNSFITNNPKRYYKLERVEERKFITIHTNLMFQNTVTPEQILTRGALLYNLVDTLEENDYGVDFNTFFIVRIANEIIYIKVNLKNINQPFRLQNVIFPLTSRDFLRRIIFRIIESMKVQEREWGIDYGSIIKAQEVSSLLSLGNKDIYIGLPNEMGIKGINLQDDIESFLNYIDIKKYVKVKSL